MVCADFGGIMYEHLIGGVELSMFIIRLLVIISRIVIREISISGFYELIDTILNGMGAHIGGIMKFERNI